MGRRSVTPPGRKAKRLRERNVAAVRVKAGRDHVMSRRAEAISARGVDKAAENLLPRRTSASYAPGWRSAMSDSAISVLSRAIESHAQPCVHGRRAIVGDVNIDTVQAFIGGPDRARGQGPLQKPVSRFGMALRIENAPAGSGLQIRAPQDDSAAAGRRGAAPLAEDFRHHFARNHARQFPITSRVGVAKRHGIDGIEQLQIVIAHIFKIPARARIARDCPLPGRMSRRNSAGVASAILSSISGSGTLENARHSDAKRTSARRTSSSGRR